VYLTVIHSTHRTEQAILPSKRQRAQRISKYLDEEGKTLRCVCYCFADCQYDEQTYQPAAFEKSRLNIPPYQSLPNLGQVSALSNLYTTLATVVLVSTYFHLQTHP
jgi:hypothetical protein